MAIKYLSGVTIDSTVLVVDAANDRVGIGTASPANNLHVYSASGSTIAIDGAGGNNTGLQYKNNGSLEAAITYVPATSQLHIFRGGDVMVIGNSNVGIGTTAPVTKLHVAGAGNVTGGNIHMGDNTNATGKWTYLTGAHYNGATNPTGISIIGSYSDASQNSVIIGGSIYEANPATNIQFWTHTATTHNLGGSERMRITSAGNVGIGTTSPASLVHIDRSSSSNNITGTPSIIISNRNSTSGTFIGGGIFNNAYRDVSDSSITAGVWFENQNSTDAGALAKQSAIVFGAQSYATGYNTPSERMRITAAGNVGIGTTSPDNVLDLGSASQGRALTWENYSNVFSAYSSGNLILAQNFYGDTATDTYKTSLTASYGAAGILISGTAAGLNGVMRFYVDNAAAKTAGAAFTPTERMQISGNGAIKFSTYGSGTFTGTVAYNLAVDSSGNIIETAGGVVDGSGTANYVTKWQDANTVTNSSITDDGTTVTATAANFVSQSNLGTAYTSFTTSGTTAIFDTITRTGAAIYQIVIAANPNSAGSGLYQDFYYGKLFIGTGYNGSAVVDVINYHQESPLPRGLYGSGGGDLTVTAVMLVGGTEYTEIAATTSYTIRIKIASYVVAGAGTTVRLQRIM